MKATKQWVILMRHGIAEPRGSQPDDERALTAKGRRRTKGSARGLARLIPGIEAIASSPLRRALETAHILADRTGLSDVELLDELRPDADPKEFLRVLDQTRERAIAFVGHEPSLSKIAAAMLGLDALPLELRKGGCYVFTVEDGVRKLEWMLAPRILYAMR